MRFLKLLRRFVIRALCDLAVSVALALLGF
jgi:hypothetical protein